MRYFILGCWLLLCARWMPATAQAPSRDGQDYALFFAVDDYSAQPRFADLPNPVASSHAIARELREMYGFSTEVVSNASRADIYTKLREYQGRDFGPDDQLFLFFSGHGDFDDFEKKGYFIPREGPRIDLTTLGNIVTQIPCRHILLAIDACYSGTIDQEIAFQGDYRRPGDDDENELRRVIVDQLRNQSRLLLTSGGKVRTPSKDGGSPFAKAILSTLRQGYAAGSNGVVLYSDLEAALERVHPRPHRGTLLGHEDGQFVFVVDRLETLAGSTIPLGYINIWAVVVGISNYATLPSLQYPGYDALRFFSFLKSPEGWALPNEQIRLLVDRAATRNAILEITSEITSRATPNDVVLFYFSGQGREGALLPFDYGEGTEPVFHDELLDMIRKSPARHKVLIADAAYSGGLSTAGNPSPLNRTLAKYYEAFATSSKGVAIMSSGKNENLALASDEFQGGVFSHFLIEGVNGAADTDGNRIITVSELFTFVQRGVMGYTDNRQQPIIRGDYDASMPIAVRRN